MLYLPPGSMSLRKKQHLSSSRLFISAGVKPRRPKSAYMPVQSSLASVSLCWLCENAAGFLSSFPPQSSPGDFTVSSGGNMTTNAIRTALRRHEKQSAGP